MTVQYKGAYCEGYPERNVPDDNHLMCKDEKCKCFCHRCICERTHDGQILRVMDCPVVHEQNPRPKYLLARVK